MAEFLVMADKSGCFHHAQGDNAYLVVVYPDHTVTHDVGSGVNAQNGFVDGQFLFLSNLTEKLVETTANLGEATYNGINMGFVCYKLVIKPRLLTSFQQVFNN